MCAYEPQGCYSGVSRTGLDARATARCDDVNRRASKLKLREVVDLASVEDGAVDADALHGRAVGRLK
jgi:hypothetical protein